MRPRRTVLTEVDAAVHRGVISRGWPHRRGYRRGYPSRVRAGRRRAFPPQHHQSSLSTESSMCSCSASQGGERGSPPVTRRCRTPPAAAPWYPGRPAHGRTVSASSSAAVSTAAGRKRRTCSGSNASSSFTANGIPRPWEERRSTPSSRGWRRNSTSAHRRRTRRSARSLFSVGMSPSHSAACSITDHPPPARTPVLRGPGEFEVGLSRCAAARASTP